MDWSRYVGVSSTTLALLTALVAVIGQSAPAVRSLFDVKDSRLHITFMGAGSRRVVLEGHVMSGDIVLLVSNDGLKAGGVVTGELQVRWTSEKHPHSVSAALWTPDDDPEIVGPGGAIAARLFLDSAIHTESGTESADVRALVTPVEKGNPLTAPIETNASCSIGVTVVNASGSTEEHQVSARCVAVHPLVLGAVRSTFP